MLKSAVISVAVFGAEKTEFIGPKPNQTKPQVFFGLMTKYEDGAVNVNHWRGTMVSLWLPPAREQTI